MSHSLFYFFFLNAYVHMISKIRRGGKRLVLGCAMRLLRDSTFFRRKALSFITSEAEEGASLAHELQQ